MNRATFLFGAARRASALRAIAGPRLNVFNWSDYVAPDTIPNFEREFGVRVRYGTYESNAEMLAQVMSGNSGWDVVFPSSYISSRCREWPARAADHDCSRTWALDRFQQPLGTRN